MKTLRYAALALVCAASATNAQQVFTQNVQVTSTTSTSPNLLVTGSGGVVFGGALGGGSIPATGDTPRMMWYPGKAAFRVGVGWGNLWDDVNIGEYSMGVGGNAFAPGFGAVALGSSSATGHQSFSAGWGSAASGAFAVAMGIGTATGSYSFAVGQSTASGYQSTAFGGGLALGDHSTAVGWSTVSKAAFSTVVGVWNELNGDLTADLPSNPIFVVGNGTGSNDRSNAFEVHRDGTIQMAPQGDISMGEFAP